MAKRALVAIAFVSILALSSCSDDENPASPPGSTETRTVVNVMDNMFVPMHVTIDYGDTVQWTHVGGAIHSSTSGTNCTPDAIWDSGELFTGQQFSVVFGGVGADVPGVLVNVDVVGTIAYYSMHHCAVGMTGTVTVNP